MIIFLLLNWIIGNFTQIFNMKSIINNRLTILLMSFQISKMLHETIIS